MVTVASRDRVRSGLKLETETSMEFFHRGFSPIMVELVREQARVSAT